MKTLNPHSDFTLSYLGEVPVRAVGVALKFFFGDLLTWDDVFDGHNAVILPAFKTNPSPVFPKGEKPNPPQTKHFPWQTVITINRPAPFPFILSGATILRERRRRREGRGERSYLPRPNPLPVARITDTNIAIKRGRSKIGNI